MNILSFTFQSSSPWGAHTEQDFVLQLTRFFEDIKKKYSILGCLQSFTFPSGYNEDNCIAVAEAVSKVYKHVDCILLGGDTSSGDSLVVTLVALIK